MSSASPKIQEPSMEEILASIRRIIADDQDGARAAKSGHPSEQPRGAEDDVLDLAEMGSTPGPASPKLNLVEQDVSFRENSQIDFDAIPLEDEPVTQPPQPAAPTSARPASAARGGDNLLSEATGTSVTHAFGLLSSTILSDNPRTLEDLVQEMLRPMLKAWLDQNLPSLVERLVRAEIERVARGHR